MNNARSKTEAIKNANDLKSNQQDSRPNPQISPSNSITISSYAKINLGLRVLKRRPDGYHDIDTVFQQIDLCDKVSIQCSPSPFNKIVLESNNPTLPTDSKNLAFQAADIFLTHCPETFLISISLNKQIPVGSGLGGGSSNAATVLSGLNRLIGGYFTKDKIEFLARRLGADVPFFIRGGTAYATGIGDILSPRKHKKKLYIVVVVPAVSISTKWAYTNLKIPLTNTKNNFNLSRFSLDETELPEWRSSLVNDFEYLVFGNYIELEQIKKQLYSVGARYASLSGSGSALYGIFDREEQAYDGVEFFRPHYSTFLARPIQSGIIRN